MGATSKVLVLTAVLGLTVVACGSPKARTSSPTSPQTTARSAPGKVLIVGCHPEPVLGTPDMPAPVFLATTYSFAFHSIRLTPPPAHIRPRMSADSAWRAVIRTPGMEANASYRMILAEWSSATSTVAVASSGKHDSVPSGENLLVWVVIGKHIWSGTEIAGNDVSSPICMYESEMWVVNASTGQEYGEMPYPPAPEFFH